MFYLQLKFLFGNLSWIIMGKKTRMNFWVHFDINSTTHYEKFNEIVNRKNLKINEICTAKLIKIVFLHLMRKWINKLITILQMIRNEIKITTIHKHFALITSIFQNKIKLFNAI